MVAFMCCAVYRRAGLQAAQPRIICSATSTVSSRPLVASRKGGMPALDGRGKVNEQPQSRKPHTIVATSQPIAVFPAQSVLCLLMCHLNDIQGRPVKRVTESSSCFDRTGSFCWTSRIGRSRRLRRLHRFR